MRKPARSKGINSKHSAPLLRAGFRKEEFLCKADFDGLFTVAGFVLDDEGF